MPSCLRIDVASQIGPFKVSGRVVSNRLLPALLFAVVAIALSWTQTAPAAGVPTIREAAAAVAAGDLKRAGTELQEILQSTPSDVHALNLLGIVRVQQRNDSEAEQLFRRAVAIDPDFAGAHASLGLLYVQMGKTDLAIPQLQESLRLDPGRKDSRAALVSAYRNQAYAVTQSGDSEKALALLIEARTVDAEDFDVQYELGITALRMSLFPDALDALNQALKLRPEDGHTLYGLGRANMALAKFDEAHEIFEHYIRLRPHDASGHYASGITLQALQRTSDAANEYEKSIELQPQQTESYFQMGRMKLEAGDLEAASDEFERVLKRAPQHAGALTGMGRIKFQQKDYAHAAVLLQQAIAADSELREARYYLGLAYARLGRKEDSEKELAVASRIEHEEVLKHQTLLKVVDPDQVHVPPEPANQ